MNKNFLEKQKNKVQNQLNKTADVDSAIKNKLFIIFNYINSLLEPEKYSDTQREDLRKLALELNYNEDTEFEKWFNAPK